METTQQACAMHQVGLNLAQNLSDAVKSQPEFTSIGEIGSRLRSERRRLGLNQTEFAALGGVSLNSQTRYETSGNFPSEYIANLALHGVDVLFVLTGAKSTKALTRGESEVIGAVQGLTEAQWAALVAMLTAFADSNGRPISIDAPQASYTPPAARIE